MAKLGGLKGQGRSGKRDRGGGGSVWKDRNFQGGHEHDGLKPLGDQVTLGPITLGGELVDPYEPIDLFPWDDVARDFDPRLRTGWEIKEISRSECEVCVTFNQFILGMDLQAPITICYQFNDKCKDLDRPEEEEGPINNPLPPRNPLEDDPDPVPTLDPDTGYIALWWYNSGGYSEGYEIGFDGTPLSYTYQTNSYTINIESCKRQDLEMTYVSQRLSPGFSFNGYGLLRFSERRTTTFYNQDLYPEPQPPSQGSILETATVVQIWQNPWFYPNPASSTNSTRRVVDVFTDSIGYRGLLNVRTGRGSQLQTFFNSFPAVESQSESGEAGNSGSRGVRKIAIFNINSALIPPIKDFPISDMTNCCDENSKLLKKIYKVLGGQRLWKNPAKLSRRLVEPGSTKEVELNDFVDFYELLIRYLDRIIGQPPWEVLIEDTDPSTPGAQNGVGRWESIGDMLKELLQIESDKPAQSGGAASDSIINLRTVFELLVRMSFELGIAHKLAAENRMILEEVLEAIGCKTQEKIDKLPMTLNPLASALKYAKTGDDKELRRILPQFMANSNLLIKYPENTDEKTLHQYLEELRQNMAVVMGAVSQRAAVYSDFSRMIDSTEFGMEMAQLLQLRQIKKAISEINSDELKQQLEEIKKRFTEGQGERSDRDKPYQQEADHAPEFNVETKDVKK